MGFGASPHAEERPAGARLEVWGRRCALLDSLALRDDRVAVPQGEGMGPTSATLPDAKRSGIQTNHMLDFKHV